MNCDHCGHVIRYTNSGDEFLQIENLPRPDGGAAVTDFYEPPQLERPMNFCDMRCLSRWAVAQISPYSGKPFVETPLPR